VAEAALFVLILCLDGRTAVFVALVVSFHLRYVFELDVR